MIQKAVRFVSITAIVVYAYACVLNGAILRDNYHAFSYVPVYTKVRKFRDESQYVYQVSIVLSYLIGLCFFVRPLILVSVFHTFLNSTFFMFQLLRPMLEAADDELYSNPPSSDWCWSYIMAGNSRVKPVPGEADHALLKAIGIKESVVAFSLPALLGVSLVLVAGHWIVNGMKRPK